MGKRPGGLQRCTPRGGYLCT